MEQVTYKACKRIPGAYAALLGGTGVWLLYVIYSASGPTAADVRWGMAVILVPVFLLTLGFASTYFGKRYDLVLDNDGLVYLGLRGQIGVVFVPWHAMESARMKRWLPEDLIVIQLKNSPFSDGLHWARGGRFFLKNSIFFVPSALEGHHDQIVSAINRRIDYHQSD